MKSTRPEGSQFGLDFGTQLARTRSVLNENDNEQETEQ